MTNPALVPLAEFGARANERSEDDVSMRCLCAVRSHTPGDPGAAWRASVLVSQLAEPFAVSLQSGSRHIQVLVRAGLVQQERTGRSAGAGSTSGRLCNRGVDQPLQQVLAGAVSHAAAGLRRSTSKSGCAEAQAAAPPSLDKE